MTAGPRGPVLLQDTWFLEKMSHFDREVIPERRMHAKGSGAYGTFTVTHDITRFWVKFHLKTRQGIKNLTDKEAEALVGKDRESHQRDLYESIEKKDFPRWTFYVQIMPEKDAATCPYHPFDLTKVWYHKDYPLIEVGVLELNKNPENFFAEVEQAAFNPANVVPGIGFSPDKMLQGRLFSYGDAQRYRLGVNHHQIPVNAPRCPYHSFHRDGAMRVDGNYGSTLGYEPNSYGEWQQQPGFAEPPLKLEGAADHWNFREDDADYFTQPGKLFRLMKPAQQKALFENTARAMGDAPKLVKVRHIGNCLKADPAYGKGVAKALGIPLSEVPK
jgi:catalase